MTADPREHYTPYPPIVPTRRDDPPIYRALARDHARRASARRNMRIITEAAARITPRRLTEGRDYQLPGITP